MEKKSILIISSFAYPHIGGVERFTNQIANKFFLAGFNVTYVCLNTENTLNTETINGIKYYRLPCFSLVNGRLPFPMINSEFFKLAKIIRKNNYDFIILNVKFYFLTLMGAWFAKKRNIPAIMIEHGSNHFDLRNSFLTVLGKIYEHTITYFLMLSKVKFYGVSEAVNQWLAHFGIVTSGIIYNGIDSSYEPEANISYRNIHKLPSKAILVSFVGRLVEEKGVLELKEALEQLMEDHNNLYLMVAGDGPLHKNFLNSQERIVFLGSIEHDHVLCLLHETDIFVLPTRSEGLPTVILEAGSRACAVIATPHGGTKEIIIDDSFGLIINDNQPETIKRALINLIEHPEKAKVLGENLKQRIHEHFDWEIIFKQLLSLVTSQLDNHESFTSKEIST